MEVSLSSLHAALAFLWRVGGAYVKYDCSNEGVLFHADSFPIDFT